MLELNILIRVPKSDYDIETRNSVLFKLQQIIQQVRIEGLKNIHETIKYDQSGIIVISENAKNATTFADIEQKLKFIIAGQLDKSCESIKLTDELFKDLGADSLDIVAIAQMCCAELDIDQTDTIDQALLKSVTVGDIVKQLVSISRR